MSKVDFVCLNVYFHEDFSNYTYVVLVTGFRPAASFLCFQYSLIVSSDICWQMTTLMLEMLYFTSSPLGTPSLSPVSTFISLLPMLQPCLPRAATSGRHILHPLQDVCGRVPPHLTPAAEEA